MAAQAGTYSLIDALIPVGGYNARIPRDIALIVLFSIITARQARFSLQIPFTPVPVTGQTLAVLLAGATLGSRRGAAAMVVYAVAGSQIDMFAGGGSVWQASS
ncbi:MAG: biotin transporter BioY, partial [Dehalococcoidia bacterium]|nr:biotin transporter BioY [Dehalococcoidia bacterium]